MQADAQKRRSRSGCTECRQRHRKCDEKKPACTGCERAGKQCAYTLRLSWGGRPFSKSRFGECMKSDPSLVLLPVLSSSGNPAFIYGSRAKASATCSLSSVVERPQGQLMQFDIKDVRTVSPVSPPSVASSGVAVMDEKETEEVGKLKSERRTIGYVRSEIWRNPFGLIRLPHHQHNLLDHFISCTTLSMSCHAPIQDMFCRILLPIAMQTPHLLSALLTLAATHRLTLGMDQSMSELNSLKIASLRQLQDALAKPGSNMDEAIVATTLTLCHADFVSDGRSPGSWRSHLQGTTAIINAHLNMFNIGELESPTSTMSLLWRWYLSIETVALLTGNLVMPNDSNALLEIRRIIGDDGIDDLAGFSSALVPIFKDINRLAIEADLFLARCDGKSPLDSDGRTQLPPDILIRCYKLIDSINMKLVFKEPKFRPTVDASLPTMHRLDFASVDKAFHHVALVQLYRRVLNLPSTDQSVQNSLRFIIDRVSKVRFLGEPCPGIAVLQPLFTAGCEASSLPDRNNINALLLNFENRYGMGNARNCRSFLQDLWAMRDQSGDVQGRIRWDKVMGTSKQINHKYINLNLIDDLALTVVERGLDILPY